MAKRLRVCVCTSYSAAAEPRAPRHALAVAALDPDLDVVFVECLPAGEKPSGYDPFSCATNIRCVAHHYAHRGHGLPRLLRDKILKVWARLLFRLFGYLNPVALGTRFLGLQRRLEAIEADIYFGHNIETLLPVCRAASRRGALSMFDSMEFYSDMGDSQDDTDRKIIHRIQQACLRKCALILASSDEMADALATSYPIAKPVALYNVPPIDPSYHRCGHQGLALYWRNSTLGFGQRGLDDALQALAQVADDVTLHLQGQLPADNGAALKARIQSLGLGERVFIHGRYSPPQAVRMASQYCVGLCLERSGVKNHHLTVSNKIFDYMMAGLVVIASDLPSLRTVIERSNGGLLFEPGNAVDLAARVTELREDRDLRFSLAANARRFGLTVANREREIVRFQEAFCRAIPHFRANRKFAATL